MSGLELPPLAGPDRAALLAREWLVTNGLGGYAAGSVAGANTRRYHGLLVAADPPPNARWVLLAGLDATLVVDGAAHPLSTHLYADGVIHPRGFEAITSFSLLGQRPVWRYRCGRVTLEQTLWMPPGENRTLLAFRGLEGGAAALRIRPLAAMRWFHALRRAEGRVMPAHAAGAEFVRVEADGGVPALTLGGRGFAFTLDPVWYWNGVRPVESARGFDDREDLFSPGIFDVELEPGRPVVLEAWAGELGSAADPFASLAAFDARGARLAPPDALPLERRLRLAADQFLVYRGPRAPSAGAGTSNTVIAGYPWFGDWGRDTMIALPGLCLATGRHAVAKQILLAYAQYVNQGMFPNVWPDADGTPSYTAVDSALWFLRALDLYLRATRDLDTLAALAPAIVDILAWYARGTRHGIHVDPKDGLLAAGVEGLQLTWMDAKIGDWVVTPRRGKPVEINALWCAGLEFARRAFERIGWDSADARTLAEQARASFPDRFWNPLTGCLFDVVDGPDGHDPAIRPNQIFAVSLDPTLLPPERARAVVAAVERELLTPVGLRSLARSDPAYHSHYGGGPVQRDGAYHQGPVWSWLLGAYVDAKLATGGTASGLAWVAGAMAAHLLDGCVGSVSEIFQPEPPFAPDGACAQAWGVAEWLRATQTLGLARP